jgi:hypothetical protein
MGTRFTQGDKPDNEITISKGGDVPARKIKPETGETNRSFAQPSPTAETKPLTPRTHASAQEEVEAIRRNTVKKGERADDEE